MKLKPCPFCGGEAKAYNGQVVCTKCWSGSACEDTTEKAIETWNRREPMDKIVEQLEVEAKRWHESGREFDDEKELGVAGGFRYAIEIVKKGGAQND